ncbi:T9SS type A sorting domain-containing protein [Algibacter pectinivorans]|uniref:Por secretion system C-terminal sorting domain-containing protein n=1 Tax=Algibacter pectinivorans TaxID=870482 RepID=A0A1I1MDN1_9FLAO|nr:T9SS type A sorting domain-containing protein [Algibacter pectinivorans]SFC81168.1 Por secretion system C-terminal sorting domain-containing protein [Algibacter pectinivorans]
MKTKLLILACLCTIFSFGQTVSTYQSTPNTNFTILTPTTGIDQSATGANANWTFNNLTPGNTYVDTYTTPTATQLTTYPGTTNVLTIINEAVTSNPNQFFIAESDTGTAITGISQGDIQLNYDTENAFIGLFPMSFETNNSGPVSGSFTYQGNNGTFTGTFSASIEAYGTLTIGTTYSETVTRMRIDQNLSFSIPPTFNDIGTLTQTVYYYFNNTTNNMDFRFSNTNVVSTILNINQTSESFEFNTTDNTLSSKDFNLAALTKLYPNPAQNAIRVNIPNNETVKSFLIYDNQGRIVSTRSEHHNNIDISNLNTGLYFLNIQTNSGKVFNKKFVKN